VVVLYARIECRHVHQLASRLRMEISKRRGDCRGAIPRSQILWLGRYNPVPPVHPLADDRAVLTMLQPPVQDDDTTTDERNDEALYVHELAGATRLL
jgi:hypothetical protein